MLSDISEFSILIVSVSADQIYFFTKSKYFYIKVLLLLLSDRITRSFEKLTKYSNYKNLNRQDIFERHIYIMRVLRVLSTDNSLKLYSIKVSKTLELSITKSQFYKKVRRLSE